MLRTWHGWFGTETGIVVLTVLALPVAALTLVVLARRRAVGEPRGWAWRRSLAEVGMVYGTTPWVWMTMLPGEHPGTGPGAVSLVPFRDLAEVLAAGPGTAVVQIGGNLVVFAALGFFGPIRFTSLAAPRRILALAAACSALIEILQYALELDRVSSVDDVLVNTVGAGLAALASRRWWRVPTSAPDRPAAVTR